MNYKIALIKGDGIGPEVVGEAVGVLEAVGKRFGHTFDFVDVLLGGCATDAVGKSYPDGTAEVCRACDAVLLGAVGGPSGAPTNRLNSGPKQRCWPFGRTWDSMQTCVPPHCAPPWPVPVP